MKKIEKIKINDIELLNDIINEKRNSQDLKKINYKKILEENKGTIEEWYKLYSLDYLLKEKEKKLEKALKTLYTNKTKSSSKILSSINKHFPNICIYCGYGEANTIDHYYPKENYSEFSIFSLNLFPVCGNCNTLKGSKIFNSQKERLFINFYTDEINKNFLYVLLDYSSDDEIPIIKYRLAEDTPEILKSHIEQLKLIDRYNNILTEEISTIYLKNKKIGLVRELKKKMLYEEYIILQKKWGYNHWKAVLYKALSENEDFLDSIEQDKSL